MTNREKIGQLIFAGFPSTIPDREFIRIVKEYKIGNVILFERNIENAEQVRQLCDELQKLIRKETGNPAFISIDQEGGIVARLSKDCTKIPGAMAVAATGKPENAYVAGKITGRELRVLGININLAPVMDVNSNPANPVIGVRSYGDNPHVVFEYGIKMMQGLNSEGVMAVLKHFPGHGDTAVDSHLSLPAVCKTMEELEAIELLPFKKAIDSDAEAIMTCHILFPCIEKENYPATMSSVIITKLLRERMGFEGLVMSDCLEMNAIKEYYGTANGALTALKAGVDMVLVSHSADLIEETVKLIESAVTLGDLPSERLDEAVSRVLRYKEKYADYSMTDKDLSVVGYAAHRNEAMRISAESITLVRDKNRQLPIHGRNILFVGCNDLHSTNVVSYRDKSFNFADFMSGRCGGEPLHINLIPQAEDMERVLSAAKGKDVVVFGIYNGYMYKGQLEILDKLCMEHGNIIAVVLHNPYDASMIEEKVTVLATYECTPLSLEALAKVLTGEITPVGRMCVKL